MRAWRPLVRSRELRPSRSGSTCGLKHDDVDAVDRPRVARRERANVGLADLVLRTFEPVVETRQAAALGRVAGYLEYRDGALARQRAPNGGPPFILVGGGPSLDAERGRGPANNRRRADATRAPIAPPVVELARRKSTSNENFARRRSSR